jgi:hypothetical protein
MVLEDEAGVSKDQPKQNLNLKLNLNLNPNLNLNLNLNLKPQKVKQREVVVEDEAGGSMLDNQFSTEADLQVID